MPRMAEGEKATQLHVSASAAPGIPRSFGDVKPHEWEGISPASYEVHGIDASRYQGEIDFAAARRSGIRFAWLKATEGGDHLDPGFAVNAPAARAAGVPVGAYHFYYFCRTPEEQAAWFIANVPRSPGDLPPVLDMEWNHLSRTCTLRPAPGEVRDSIERFTAIVGRHYGTRPVIYTTPDFYAENDLGQLRGQEFWLRAVTKHPSEHYPDERWSFWQYTGTGIVPGVAGKVDLNAFGGGQSAWQGWLSSRRQ
ncbi:MAG: glycoside hydrolase [Vannielia sp.]|nr:glycoside hydrolase [Oceanicola sp. 502str15]